MDFVSYIRERMSRLDSRVYVNHMWKEGIQEKSFCHRNNEEILEVTVEEFNNHLPLILEQFWEEALDKLLSLDLTIDDIDQDLKIYMMVLLHHSMTQSHDNISHNCVMYASQIYIKLLTSDLSEELYKSHMYQLTLQALQTGVVTGSSNVENLKLIQLLREFLLRKAKLQNPELEVTLAALVEVIFVKNQQAFTDFALNCECQSISHEAFVAIKALLHNEATRSKIFIITTYLFNGLRKCDSIHITPMYLNILQRNFRSFIKDSHEKFNEDHYKTFMNAFIHIWKHPSFVYFNEAVMIMNELHPKYYRALVNVLNALLTSTDCHKNHLRLSLAVIFNSPNHTTLDKIKVHCEILARNILLNILSKKTEVSNAALETFGELVLSPNLQKNTIFTPIKNVLNCPDRNLLDSGTILRGLKSLMVKKWGSKCRNRSLFSIIIAIMFLSDRDHTDMYSEILDVLTEEASPYDLKVFVPHLFNLYPELYRKNFKSTALEVLKVIFKMSLHPMATSGDFVKPLYLVMVTSDKTKNPGDIYVAPIISDNFNYKEFFRKAHTLGMIKRDHVKSALDRIDDLNEAHLKLVCALIDFTDYRDPSRLSHYMQANFMTLCSSPNVKYVLYIFNVIVQKCPNEAADDIEVAINFLKHHLHARSFRYNAISNAFSLLKTLEKFDDFTSFYGNLKEDFDSKLDETLPTENSFLPLYYSSQFVLFTKKSPSDANMKKIKDFIQLCQDDTFIGRPEFNPQIQMACLGLLTNVSIIQPDLVDFTLNSLRSALDSPTRAVKLAAIDLMFDVCNMVTHTFGDFINYMFVQLLGNDDVFKRTCLEKIDKLMRDDYLKLNLDEFLLLAAILGDEECALADYWHRILTEHFYISSPAVIAKYFVPLIIHLNNYQKHPVYVITSKSWKLESVIGRVVDRRKIYMRLFVNLSTKLRFAVVYSISVQILELITSGRMSYGDGYWSMIKDCAYIFKLMKTCARLDEGIPHDYHKKVMGRISKFLLQNKKEMDAKHDHAEYRKEIVESTCGLMKLLQDNDNNDHEKHLGLDLFDAIIHWTDFLMFDLAHFIHYVRCKQLENYYRKLEKIYKKKIEALRVDDNFML